MTRREIEGAAPLTVGDDRTRGFDLGRHLAGFGIGEDNTIGAQWHFRGQRSEIFPIDGEQEIKVVVMGLDRLGGQALLAQLLPGRGDFGGLITNLNRELQQAGAQVVMKQSVTAERVLEEDPDAIVLATGARPRLPEFEQAEDAHVLGAWEVVSGKALKPLRA